MWPSSLHHLIKSLAGDCELLLWSWNEDHGWTEITNWMNCDYILQFTYISNLILYPKSKISYISCYKSHVLNLISHATNINIFVKFHLRFQILYLKTHLSNLMANLIFNLALNILSWISSQLISSQFISNILNFISWYCGCFLVFDSVSSRPAFRKWESPHWHYRKCLDGQQWPANETDITV